MDYGACDKPEDEYAMRIAYLIGPDGKILEAHSQVNPTTFPETQLESIRIRANGA